MIRRPPRSTRVRSSAASDVYKRQTQLRPQGHDIIRTWAFYTILRSDALVGRKPWESVLVNGMVLGKDNQKMSKSLGNIIAPETVIEQYGTDALRQWAAIGGSVGSDVPYSTCLLYTSPSPRDRTRY